MRIRLSRRTFIWIAVFVCLFSALLSIFFFVQVWLPGKRLVDSYDKSDCFIGNVTVFAKETFLSCHSENTNLWWYSTFRKLFYAHVVDVGGDPSSSDDWNDPGKQGLCYIGLVTVNYNIDADGDEHGIIQSQIAGLWSANPSWVSGYLVNFHINETINCYYSVDNPLKVLPFAPIASDLGQIIGITFSALFGVSLLSIIVLSILKSRSYANDDPVKDPETKKLLTGDYYKYEDENSPNPNSNISDSNSIHTSNISSNGSSRSASSDNVQYLKNNQKEQEEEEEEEEEADIFVNYNGVTNHNNMIFGLSSNSYHKNSINDNNENNNDNNI